MVVPKWSELVRFAHLAAGTLYDGRPCSHEDGCHYHESCQAGCGISESREKCACPMGECCEPVDMGGDEEHDNLFELVSEARQVLGLPDLDFP